MRKPRLRKPGVRKPPVFPVLGVEYNPAFPEVAVKLGMILPVALLASLSLISAGWGQSSAVAAQPVTVIRAGTLLDGTSGWARHNVVITIRGNKITEVADG